jgi:hypothetical protein
MSTESINAVQKLYIAYFSRPADYAGLNYWSNLYDQNHAALQQMSHDFALSNEYRETYAQSSNRQVVDAVYQHLFGRAAETAGLDYWTPLLDNHAITIDNVVTQIAAGARNNDLFAYNAKVAVATSFTSHLDLSSEQTAYSGSAANKIAIDFIASVKDLNTAAAGMDPGMIDSVITHIVNVQAEHTTVVGVQEPVPGMVF